ARISCSGRGAVGCSTIRETVSESTASRAGPRTCSTAGDERGQRSLHADRGCASRAVRTDRAVRRTVADQLDARILHGRRAAAVSVELDAAGLTAQVKRAEVPDGGAEPGGPED